MCRCGECFGCAPAVGLYGEDITVEIAVFSPDEWYEMAAAAERLSWLNAAPLSDLAYRIATIDHPYYSRLSGETYLAAVRSRTDELARLVVWASTEPDRKEANRA